MPEAATLPRYQVVEALGDGRALVVAVDGPDAGAVFVHGESHRPPEAARMGRLPLRVASDDAPPGRTRRSQRAYTDQRFADPGFAERRAAAAARRVAASVEQAEADIKAEALFMSLLDRQQRVQWRAHRACWVDTPRGPVRLGRPHDLRFRPVDQPGVEMSLCVVPSGPPLPHGDVCSNLLLVLSVDPERFFAVANRNSGVRQPSRPHPPAACS